MHGMEYLKKILYILFLLKIIFCRWPNLIENLERNPDASNDLTGELEIRLKLLYS